MGEERPYRVELVASTFSLGNKRSKSNNTQNVDGGDVAWETKQKKGKEKKRKENRLPSLAAAMPAANLIPWIFFLLKNGRGECMMTCCCTSRSAGRLPYIFVVAFHPSIHPAADRTILC